jgi:hypothetical protein
MRSTGTQAPLSVTQDLRIVDTGDSKRPYQDSNLGVLRGSGGPSILWFDPGTTGGYRANQGFWKGSCSGIVSHGALLDRADIRSNTSHSPIVRTTSVRHPSACRLAMKRPGFVARLTGRGEARFESSCAAHERHGEERSRKQTARRFRRVARLFSLEMVGRHGKIEWSWVKAHSGILLNECGDMLATKRVNNEPSQGQVQFLVPIDEDTDRTECVINRYNSWFHHHRPSTPRGTECVIRDGEDTAIHGWRGNVKPVRTYVMKDGDNLGDYLSSEHSETEDVSELTESDTQPMPL